MSIPKINTIFIGTPDFGLPAFKALLNDGLFNIVAAVTQPDKKVGRKQVIASPAIKIEALKRGIPVWQPDRIRDFVWPIADIDLILVAAYAQIIPEKILDWPKYGCINIHGSLLPLYRGAACVQQAIIDGQEKTGITIMKMDAGLDTGAIIAQKEIPISDNDTAGSLYQKLAHLAGENILPIIKDFIAGNIMPQAQDNARATYVKMLKKEAGRIDWNKPALDIERFIRAMHPWPGAFSKLNDGQIVKIIKASGTTLNINKHEIGTLFSIEKKLAVQCGHDAIEILELQLEGKKAISGEQFLNGYSNLIDRMFL